MMYYCNNTSLCLASACKQQLSHEASLASCSFADVATHLYNIVFADEQMHVNNRWWQACVIYLTFSSGNIILNIMQLSST